MYHVANIQVERYKWECMWEVHEPVLGVQSLCAVSARSLRREPKLSLGCIPDHEQLSLLGFLLLPASSHHVDRITTQEQLLASS